MSDAAKVTTIVAQSYVSVLKAVNPPPPRDRVQELKDQYLRGDITLISFELQLEHMPGGIPNG